MSQKELPDGSYGSFLNLKVDADHPLGYYDDASYDFLAKMSSVMEIPPTRKEKLFTRDELRRIRTDNKREETDKFRDLELDVNKKGGKMKTSMSESSLSVSLIFAGREVGIERENDMTKISFHPYQYSPFNMERIYRLLFQDLPSAINPDNIPDPRYLKSYTGLLVSPKNGPTRSLNLGIPSQELDFMRFMERPDDLNYVTFGVHTPRDLTRFRLKLPNPRRNSQRFLEYSFPSGQELNIETMAVLLNLHEKRDAPAPSDLTETLTDLTNSVRKRLRV